MKLALRILLLAAVAAFIVFVPFYLINRHIESKTDEYLKKSITEIPIEEPRRVAVVFGASVKGSGEPSDALRDRIVTAVELYRAGRVKKILMSGDNMTVNYDEPTAMKETALKLKVPAEDIVLDFAGRRTYDTCHRAKEVFEVNTAILVTQEFHLPRALYLCREMGIESVGLTADRRKYDGLRSWTIREFFSTVSAWFEVNFYSFEPVGGKKEPIGQ